MARIDWFDDETNLPLIDERVQNLQHFVDSMADGLIERKELDMQQANLVESMKAVEASLNDEQHGKVTNLLVEISAYNVMRVLHELQQARLQNAIGKK
jgi:hypothetical protein